MADRWKNVVLSDVIEIISGGTPKTNIPEYWGGQIPWLSVADFNTGFKRVHSAEKSITDKGLAESATTVLSEGDIIISARGTVGVIAQLAVPMAFNQSCYGIRGIQGESDTDFIYYVLRHAVTEMKQIAHGGVFDTITRDTFKIINIDLPPIPEQHAIAHIFGTLDDKIELNRQMNATLQAIAQALFTSWFVDFDPTHARAAGQQPPGLSPEIADLFPDTFVESEIGLVPTGWGVAPIGDMVQVMGGGTPSTKEPLYWEDGIYPFCTPKDMSSLTSSVVLHTERQLTDAGLAKVSSGQLPIGTVLLSSRAPIGYLAIAETPVSINQGIIAMVCDKELPNLYVLQWTKNNMERIIANANGSTFLEISKRNFRPISVLVPPPALLVAYMDIAEPIHQRITANLRESELLATTRDMLLPKLLAGELHVCEAEYAIGGISK